MTMRTGLKLYAACLLLLSAPGASNVTLVLAGQKEGAARPFDACALLTAKDIEAVQGEAVAAVKSSRPGRGPFDISQCYYTLPTFSRSISLEIARKDAGRPSA